VTAVEVLSDEAVAFVSALDRQFRDRRHQLLARRRTRGPLGFLAETRAIREDPTWRVPPPPADLADRRVEITGPTDAKTIINALNCGARVFMADFEDATSPTWSNLLRGQGNVAAAVRRQLRHESPDGRVYELGEAPATLLVRPRGWHLDEPRLVVDGEPVSGALFDAGLHLWHNHGALADIGSAPYFYLPKLESHHEAALWHDVFAEAEDALDLARGTVRATVLIETIPAAFEMEEILHALGEHALGLNAGRWDYLFSIIKTFRDDPAFVLPDRNQVTMTAPFMRAYTELLVATCHRRGAMAIGGMSAFVPSRRDADANARAIDAVSADKTREAADGFDGTWVAHPDLVPTAMAAFDAVLGQRPNQLDRRRDDVAVSAADLLDVAATPGEVTLEGVRTNVQVGLEYLRAWLGGQGAVAINGLMEDAATAEICRSQLWHWLRHGLVERDVVDDLIGPGVEPARQLFRQLVLGDELVDFLTVPAMELLP
jgi:malate synthase